jgi:transposase-like protein
LNLTARAAPETYIIAGHKGQPTKVKATGRPPRRRRLKGKRGRGTSADEKNPVLGLTQRGGCVFLKVLPNVKQSTIRPVFEQHVLSKSLINTDEYNIYSKLTTWGYEHKTVNHGQGEYARDEDGDGFCEPGRQCGSL